MLKKFQDIFSIPELKRRILFTIGLLVVYRIGGHITGGDESSAPVNSSRRGDGTRSPRQLERKSDSGSHS